MAQKFKIHDIVGVINSEDQDIYQVKHVIEDPFNNEVYYGCISHCNDEAKLFRESDLGLLVSTETPKQEYPDHQLHLQLIMEMHEIYKVKNIDYGSSFAEQYEEYGILSAIIRFDDKIRRLKQLLKSGQAQVKDESLKDTVKDLANYAVMLWMELEKDSKSNIKWFLLWKYYFYYFYSIH